MDAIKTIKQKMPEAQLIAGNVGTYEGARELISLGVGRHQGRDRPRLHLHHARGVRRRRSADYGHRRMRPRGARRRRAADRPMAA